MPKVKYAVWFHGNEDEPQSICYEFRKPFYTDKLELAIDFLKFMKDNNHQDDKYSICTITIEDVS